MPLKKPKKKKCEKERDHLPCTGYPDHLRQKSFGGPPIHRVIQILTIFIQHNVQMRHMKQMSHHINLSQQKGTKFTCTVIPIVGGSRIIQALINNILRGSFIVHSFNLFKGSCKMQVLFHALNLKVRTQTLNNPESAYKFHLSFKKRLLIKQNLQAITKNIPYKPHHLHVREHYTFPFQYRHPYTIQWYIMSTFKRVELKEMD